MAQSQQPSSKLSHLLAAAHCAREATSRIALIGVITLSLLLSACGGGGGGSDNTSSPPPDGGTPPPIPTAPTGLSAAAGNQQATLTWTAVSGATGYNLYWSQSTGVTKTSGTQIANVTSGYTHTELTAGTTYYYIVTALNANGESSESTQTSATPFFTISGTAVMNTAYNGASISLYALNDDGTKGAQLGVTTTADAQGNFTINLASAPTAPILAEAFPGTYVDVVTGSTVSPSSQGTLAAVIPVGVARIAITPLTTLAAARARALAAQGTALAIAVAAANARVAQQFSLTDILTTIPPSASNQLQASLATINERAYALVLAGLSQEAATLGVYSYDLIAGLADDISDGQLDGLQDSSAIQIPIIPAPTIGTITLSASAGTAGLQSAIDSFAATTLNQTQLATQTVAPDALSISVSGANSLYITLTALPAWISGQTSSTLITASGGTAPYTCMLSGGSLPFWLTLSNDCSLSGTAPLLAGGSTRTVYAPVTITLTDALSHSQSAILVPIVIQAAPSLALVSPLPAATVGQSYSQPAIASTTGGTSPYYYRSDTFAVGAPPLGMIIDLNGNLVGVPSAAGTYTFGVCAIDLVGASSCSTTTVTVNPSSTAVTAAVYTGSFNGTGTFTRDFGVTVCTFSNTYSGTVTLVTTQTGNTTTATAQVQGSWVSQALAGSTSDFTCLDTSTSWQEAPTVTVSGNDIAFSTVFTTPSGSTSTGAFLGTLSGSSIAGDLVETIDTSSGSANMSLVLTEQ